MSYQFISLLMVLNTVGIVEDLCHTKKKKKRENHTSMYYVLYNLDLHTPLTSLLTTYISNVPERQKYRMKPLDLSAQQIRCARRGIFRPMEFLKSCTRDPECSTRLGSSGSRIVLYVHKTVVGAPCEKRLLFFFFWNSLTMPRR